MVSTAKPLMMKVPVMFAESFREKPFWWEAANPADNPSSDLPDDTDVTVIGSGYSGISVALELGRAGTRVCVLDEQMIGYGASTRNGGMLSTEPKFETKDVLAAKFGERVAARVLEDGRDTFTNLKEVIEREGIECHLEQNGRFVGAHCPSAYRSLEKRARQYEADGLEGFELVPRARQKEVIGQSDYYYGGLHEPDGGSLHPGLYHQGLVTACSRHGVSLCGKTAAVAIMREADGFLVRTQRGVIRSREVVLGTNGYTGRMSPWQRERLIPIGSFIIATEEIGEERVETMFRGFCTMSNTQRVLFYYRPSPDHRRVLFGGRASFSMSDATTTAPRLHNYMCRVYPGLRDVSITHAWTGNVAFTFDYLPHMGMHEGVHYCMGCNGAGVAMMSYLGRQIGLKILGRTNRACAFEEIPFRTRPLYQGTPWFMPIVGNWYRFRDWVDRSLA